VRAEFTRQADAYAATPSIANPDRIERLINLIDPIPDWRALEVATGPGYVAMALALRCREVIGVDLTDAPIEIAKRLSNDRALSNISFQVCDADQLPFRNGEFDLVVCRFAFHHFENPSRTLEEMSRVLRAGGIVAVEDLITSEHPERAAYQNRIEKLRDPSHTRALPLSELVTLIASARIEIESFYADQLTPDVETWLAVTQTPPEVANRVREHLERDRVDDLSGLSPFLREGRMLFTQRTAAIVGRKLSPLQPTANRVDPQER
jgi:SAM-dependent methyltransferase